VQRSQEQARSLHCRLSHAHAANKAISDVVDASGKYEGLITPGHRS
jgi:hypothetical protein